MKRLLLLVLASSTALLAGCTGDGIGSVESGDKKMEMRVYQVAPEDTDAMVGTLNKLFIVGEKGAIGQASSPGRGQIVVLAPTGLQNSIGETLKSLKPIAKIQADVAAAKQLQLNYWSINAIPGKGSDDPALASLATALMKVRSNLGDVHFQLNGHVSSASSPGQTVNADYTSAVDPTNASSFRSKIN